MRKALIVGSSSFFGKHFINKAREILELTCLTSRECNLLTDQIFKYNTEKYDYIFYFAVKTHAGGYCQKHPGEQFIINQTMNTNILNYWLKEQPQAKFVTFGSSCSYSDDAYRNEDNYLNGLCETGYEVYGNIKRMLLVGLRAFNKEYGMNYMFYVPSCLYGPNYREDDKHFIYDLIRKICTAESDPSKVATLWGDGHQRRELIYIEDAVDILLDNLERENEIINLSTGADHSIREYAMAICDSVGYNFDKIQFDPDQFVGAKQKKLVVNCDKLKDCEFTSYKEGLQRTISYYTDNYAKSK